MKRINPVTGKPFMPGDIRQDGCIFSAYTKVVKRNGFFREQWYSPNGLKNKKECSRICSKKYSEAARLSELGRAKELLRHAKDRGPVSISLDWVHQEIKKGRCALSNLPFDLSPTKVFGKNPNSPSLDRIDPNDPEYSYKNTRVVLTCVNQALNQYGLNHFLKIAQAVIDHQKDRPCQTSKNSQNIKPVAL